MRADTSIKKSIFTAKRYWILLFGIVLFMPPLSFLFQFTQDSNFCGAWCPRMFIVWHHGATTGAFLSGMARSFMGVAIVLVILIGTFFLGRVWCSHLCPVGGTSEMGSRLIPEAFKFRLDSVPASPVRYGYLSAYLVLPALGLGSLCCTYCNFAAVPRLLGAPFSQADAAYFLRAAGIVNLGLLAVLGFFVKGGRGYCNLLCPVGALDALSNRFGERFGRRMRIAGDQCNGCGRCRDVCPVWAVETDGQKAQIDHLSCIPCGLCMKACPENAVVYSLKKESKEEQVGALPSYALTGSGGKDRAA